MTCLAHVCVVPNSYRLGEIKQSISHDPILVLAGFKVYVMVIMSCQNGGPLIQLLIKEFGTMPISRILISTKVIP